MKGRTTTSWRDAEASGAQPDSAARYRQPRASSGLGVASVMPWAGCGHPAKPFFFGSFTAEAHPRQTREVACPSTSRFSAIRYSTTLPIRVANRTSSRTSRGCSALPVAQHSSQSTEASPLGAVTRIALTPFNDVILRVAFEFGLGVIDLRAICTEAADYANPIEPSGLGGAKIAKAIAESCGVLSGTSRTSVVRAG